MIEGQHGARRTQRGLAVVMVVALVCMWNSSDTQNFDRAFLLLVVCYGASTVIDAMRALSR